MTATALAHTYRYAEPSAVVAGRERSPHMRLATSGGVAPHPHFLTGNLVQPQLVASLLLGLADVVRSRWFVPMTAQRLAAILDPVVTSGDQLRFEVFSACCSTYARVDLADEAIEADRRGHGTTNVDFNDTLRAALSGLRGDDPARLSVGWEGIELETGAARVIEKKVKLPVRWLKGFVEVQAHQTRMRPALECSGEQARRFLRELPRGGSRGRPMGVTSDRLGLKMTQRPDRDAVVVAGIERLRVLEPLAARASRLEIARDELTGSSIWTLFCDIARFHLVLSPEVDRGFSGEGQVLHSLASNAGAALVARVRATLAWQSALSRESLAQRLGAEVAAIDGALNRLATAGLVGFDTSSGHFFRRELPFDLGRVETLHPRLRDARELVAAGAVQLRPGANSAQLEAEVQGESAVYLVRITPERARCTCRWYAKHDVTRGPCKHVLAAQIAAGRDTDGLDA